MIGSTISLAGKPKMKAIKITPSNPNNLAKGSRTPHSDSVSSYHQSMIFAISQIIRPAGIATTTALPKTNSVRSKIDLTMIFPI